MKIILLLSLAAFCLANRHQGRPQFSFPGPSSGNRSHTLEWNNFVKSLSQSEETSAHHHDGNRSPRDAGFALFNPNRKDVKIEQFPGLRFQPGKSAENKQENSFLSESSSEESSHSDSHDKESSSTSSMSASDEKSSSSGGDNSESHSADNEEPSVNNIAVSNQEESQSKEESAGPAANEESEVPSNDQAQTASNDNTEEPATDEGNNVPPPSPPPRSSSEEHDHSKLIKKKILDEILGFQPSVPANNKGRRFALRDVDVPRPSKKPQVRSRGTRGIGDFGNIVLSVGKNQNIGEPQGQIKGTKKQRQVGKYKK
ncbi:uncharacterized protein [Hyperolius riggenbachi]|uniref:uncharacterized protein n=1 Tax=Hyperolius riggenbachi TaxID=752182 RepID=UPI0035A39E14